MEFLKNFWFPENIIPLVKLRLTRLFDYYNDNHSTAGERLKLQKDTLEKKMKALKIRHGLGEIDKETFDLTAEHITQELYSVTKELQTVAPRISNLDKLLSASFKRIKNISRIWSSSGLEMKQRIQKVLFPEGIFYDPEKHEYRTTRVNRFVVRTCSISSSYDGNKKRDFQNLFESPAFVV